MQLRFIKYKDLNQKIREAVPLFLPHKQSQSPRQSFLLEILLAMVTMEISNRLFWL